MARRLPLGKDRITLYIGKPTREGRVPVSKHASREVVVIDKDFRITGTATVGDEGAFACDVDVAAGPGSLDRVLVPTDTANTVVSLDAKTLQVVWSGLHLVDGEQAKEVPMTAHGILVDAQHVTAVALHLLGQRLGPARGLFRRKGGPGSH